jgi:hypothetical protein
VASFSLYLLPFYHFSTGIKAKRTNRKNNESLNKIIYGELPTVYELASLAAQLRPNTPEAQNDPRSHLPSLVLTAADLWKWARAQVSSLRAAEGGEVFLKESKEKILKKVKPPKKFPVTLDKMVQGLLPKRSATDRDRIAKDFLGACEKDWHEAFGLEFETIKIDEPKWKHYVFLFHTWFPAYQRDLRIKKASKAAKSLQLKKQNAKPPQNPESKN